MPLYGGYATLGANTFTGAQTITQGTITADAPQLNGTVTWSNAGVTFTAWKLNVTDTNSNSASLLVDLQVGGTTQFNVDKGGNQFGRGNAVIGAAKGFIWSGRTALFSGADAQLKLSNNAQTAGVVLDVSTNNTIKFSDSAGTAAATMQFGTRSAIAAETVTGYITIKDYGGTDRKLAVVS